MSRRNPNRSIKPAFYLVAEGKVTEYWYFTHIKSIYIIRNLTIKPSLCGQIKNIKQLKKKAEECLRKDGKPSVICVYDLDVYTQPAHAQELQALNQWKQKHPKNIIFCESLPSIEFWFLLHHKNTNQTFVNSKACLNELKKHISLYGKSEKFAKHQKWVEDLCANGQLSKARKRAKRIAANNNRNSYTSVYKAFDALGI